MDSKISELDINNLLYVPSTPVELTLNRVLRKFYPEKTNYNATQKVVIRLHGNQFIDMKNSSLRFKFKPEGTGSISFGVDAHAGSYVNIANRVRVLSSTGKVISDVLENNILQRFLLRLKHREGYLSFVGSSFGIGEVSLDAGDEYEVCVPMRHISPFWDNDQLLPPRIAEGLTIEIFLTRFEDVGIVDSTITGYEISDLELIADSVLCNDSTTNLINNMINDTMVFEYKDWLHHQGQMSENASRGYLVMSEPASNALEVLTILRDDMPKGQTENNYNSVPIPTDLNNNPEDEMVYRIGDIQLPQQTARSGRQIYNVLLNSVGVLDRPDKDFSLKINTFNDVAGVFACYYQNLRTSKIIETSGREISNQQNLSIDLNSTQLGPSTGQLDMWVQYVGRIVIRKGFLTCEK